MALVPMHTSDRTNMVTKDNLKSILNKYDVQLVFHIGFENWAEGIFTTKKGKCGS